MTSNQPKISSFSLTTTLAFAIFPVFFGIFGLHRLYVKRLWGGLFMTFISVAFIVNLIIFASHLFLLNSPLAALGNFSGLVISFLLPAEVIVALMYFYDFVILLGLRFKDADGALILPPKPILLSTRSFGVTLFLAINGGWVGLHRIYLGKTKSGILMLLSGVLTLFLLFAGIALLTHNMTVIGGIFLFIPTLHLIWWAEDILHIIQFRLLDERGLPVCRN